MSEQELKTAIEKAINATYRAFVWVQNSGRAKGGKIRLAPEGCPDIFGFMLRDGRAVGIEVKKPGHRPCDTKPERRELQAEWGRMMLAAGCIWGQVTSVEEAVRLVMGVR